MGFLDRFRKQREQIGKDKKPKHVVRGDRAAKSAAAEEQKRKAFAAVPSAATSTSTTPKTAGPEAARSQKSVRRETTGDAYRVLLRAIVTEQSTMLSAQRQYVFAIAPTASKIDVARAVRSLYGVAPMKVNVLNVRGKAVRYGRSLGQTKRWRKAIVTLQPGQTMNVSGS